MRNPSHSLTLRFLTLALPVVLIQGGIMAMVLVDTIFVGRLGAVAMAGVGLGSTLVTSITIFCAGTLTAIEYFSSKALGEGDEQKSWFWFLQASYLAVLLSVGAMVATVAIIVALPWMGIERAVTHTTAEFLWPIGISCLPAFLFFTARQYLSSKKNVAFSVGLVLAGNVVNYFLNWVLVEGNLGVPAMGVRGSAIGTLLTRSFLVAGMFTYVFRSAPRLWFVPDAGAIRAMLKLGLPAGAQMLARSLVFSVAGIFVAQLGPVAMAAHTISLTLGSFLYMVPLGMGTAACILVAHAVGENDRQQALRIGNNAVRITVGLMTVAGIGLFFYRYQVLGVFTHDPQVIAAAAILMVLVALLQLFDGYQATIIGALRGFGDSKASLNASLIGLWGVGLPLAGALGIGLGYGVAGLWSGLIFGLLTSSVLLVFRWRGVAAR